MGPSLHLVGWMSRMTDSSLHGIVWNRGAVFKMGFSAQVRKRLCGRKL
jgi:hypothetical protein